MEKHLYRENIAKFPDLLLPELNTENSEIINGFRERVKTFVSNRVWIAHQTWLYPTICAQYGWKCVSNQLLQCETCYANLSPTTLSVKNIALHQTYIKNTFEKLKTAHQKHCPWTYSPCPDHYVRIYPMHKDEAYQAFVKRFKSLYLLREQLPQIKEGTADKMGLSADVCSSLCKVSFIPENAFSKSALLLAIVGWLKDSESKSAKNLICQSCQRSVPLFLYTSLSSSQCEISPIKQNCSKSHSTNGNASESIESSTVSPNSSLNKDSDNEISSPKLKKRRTSTFVVAPFDPLYEHRSWCPWLIDSIENMSSVTDNSVLSKTGIPGWQLFIKCLLRNVKDSNISPNAKCESLTNHLKRARDMLESWNSQSAE